LRQANRVLLPLMTALVFLGAWEASVRLLSVRELILPPPSRILMVFHSSEALSVLENTIPTLWEAVTGFSAAVLLGFLLAVVISYSFLVKEALYPYLIAFQVIPKMALAPIFVLWLGIGFGARFAFATFICFFPVVISLTTGLRQTRPEVVLMGRSLGASKSQLFLHIRLPFALLYLFAGMKISATMSIIGVVIAEFITADKGLGFLILAAASRSNTPLLMASILVLCVAGFAIYGAVVGAERLARMSFDL
jgi:NitT/TauT family transport system permease protein